jgi:hypothetical protein
MGKGTRQATFFRQLRPVVMGHCIRWGDAAATSISLAFKTVLLFAIVRRRLGLHVLAFGKRAA